MPASPIANGRSNSATRKEIDRDFPHQVEIIVRRMDVGIRLHEMSEYCRSNRFEHRTRGIGGLRLSRGCDGIRWCFRAEQHAVAFHRIYGGVNIPCGQNRRSS